MENNTVEVLKQRDGLGEDEAVERVSEVRDEMLEIAARGGDLDEVEDLLMNELGLEPDFLEDMLF